MAFRSYCMAFLRAAGGLPLSSRDSVAVRLLAGEELARCANSLRGQIFLLPVLGVVCRFGSNKIVLSGNSGRGRTQVSYDQ